MKKIEAKELSPKRSEVIMEYIDLILIDSKNHGKGKIEFFSAWVEGRPEEMSVATISVPDTGYSRMIDNGIASQQRIVFYGQILRDLIDNFLDSDKITLGLFHTIRGGMGRNFDGVTIHSALGSSLEINFRNASSELREEIEKYNQTLQLYREGKENTIVEDNDSIKRR